MYDNGNHVKWTNKEEKKTTRQYGQNNGITELKQKNETERKNSSTASRNNRNESKYIDVTNAALCDIVFTDTDRFVHRRKENEIKRVILITMNKDLSRCC